MSAVLTPARRLQAVHRRRLGRRAPEAREVAVARHPLVPLVHQPLKAPPFDPLRQAVAGHDLDLDLRHHAQHADRHLRRGQQIGRRLVDHDHLAGAVDDPAAAHRGREALQTDARPVGGGADRAADALCVDVALVGKREARVPERLAEHADGRPRQGLHASPGGVDLGDPGQIGEIEHRARRSGAPARTSGRWPRRARPRRRRSPRARLPAPRARSPGTRAGRACRSDFRPSS